MIRFLLLQTSAAPANNDLVWEVVIGLIVVLCAGLLIYYRKQISQFTGEVRTELVKATWPWDPKEHGFKRYKELADSTLVVVVAMLLLAGYISLCDLCLQNIVGALTKTH
jgi:preprotein translocase subunit SecE